MKKRISILVKRLNATDDQLFADAKIKYPNAVINLKGGRYLYVDNGSNVLAVAHVDTVARYAKSYWSNTDKKYIVKAITTPAPNVKKMTVTSIKLDDRLGVHLVMDILPMLGINVDILLTEDEEWAQSTAALFVADKKYNWGFSFDRRGVGEVVMYQYDDDKDAVGKVMESGWYLGQGTYSDIADLDIGCSCFNFSAGYIGEHTDGCYCQYDAVMYCAQLFKKFYLANKDIRFPFDNSKSYSRYERYNYNWWKENQFTYSKEKDHKKDSQKVSTTSGSTLKKYVPISKNEYEGLEPCEICGRQIATTWDYHGSPICDDCWFDMYDEPNRECEYCGNTLHKVEDFSGSGEVEDDEFENICASCAEWLRANMNADELKSITIKMKRRAL